MKTTINGVLVGMSAGLYVPMIEVVECATDRHTLCEYGSPLAAEAGLANPQHWAHAVYRTLDRLCAEHQEELQGGSMENYEETRADRAAARRGAGA